MIAQPDYDGRFGLPNEQELLQILSAGGSLAPALSQLSQEKRVRYAASMTAEFADRPRYVSTEDWPHFFSDGAPEVDTRWVFDRHQWRLTVMHVKPQSSSTWLGAMEDERDDLDDSLLVANPEALRGEFELDESDELPAWVKELAVDQRESFVKPWVP